MKVRILDTPGLEDTRRLQQDEIHRSIANKIKEHVDSVTAVIILASGTVPRITVGTDHALSTLSAIFPRSLAGNIAFMLTNVSSPPSGNFIEDAVPDALKHAPLFFLDNPTTLQKKYDKLKNDPNSKKILPQLRNEVKQGEKAALEMLVDFYDWLDGLQPQPTMEILYEKSQRIEQQIIDTLAQMEQATAKKSEIAKLMEDIKESDTAVSGLASHVGYAVTCPRHAGRNR